MPQSVQSSILWAVPKPRKLGELWHKSIRNKMLGWDVGFCCCHLWLLQVKITMTCNINLQVWHFACYIICFKIASTDFAFASCLRLIYSVSSEWCRALAHKVIPKMTYNVLSVELNPTMPALDKHLTCCMKFCFLVGLVLMNVSQFSRSRHVRSRAL